MNTVVDSAQEIGWRTVVNSCSKQTRKVARMWLAYTIFYWLIPTVIVICGLAIAKKEIKVINLLVHGELLIYSITLVASSTRLITKDLPTAGPFVNRQGFNLASHIMIFPAIFVYGLIRYIGITDNAEAVSKSLVVTYSLVLLVVAFFFSYIVFIIDAQRSTPDDVQKRASEAIAQSPNNLSRDFDELSVKYQNNSKESARVTLESEFEALEGGR